MNTTLANYAVKNHSNQGRKYPQRPHNYRTDFERDRDRIIHSAAFRRLEGKTQVFTPGLDDYYRTRLTHSIEVAQIGRTIARALQLNQDLTEAICLGHDLGHCPFGHQGEKIMDQLTKDIGGFEHNRQSLRIVDLIEHPYPDFAGLNLMFETRLGLAKHKTAYDNPDDDLFQMPNCSLEGQIADLADRIAYNCHDLEDGMRARIIENNQLKNIDIFCLGRETAKVTNINDHTIQRTRTAKAIIDLLVSDCILASKKKLKAAKVKTVRDVCSRETKIICISKNFDEKLKEMEKFLLNNFYLHEKVTATIPQIKQWLNSLFSAICKKPDIMPGYFAKLAEKNGLQRTICDYITGMTDRYCLKMLKEI